MISKNLEIKKFFIKISLIIMFYSFMIGCENSVESNSSDWKFASLQHHNELYLIQTDDRFGEWGGNTFFIRIYRENQTEQILLDYKEYKGRKGPPPPPHPDSIPSTIIEWYEREPIIIEKTRIKVSISYLKLIADAVQELLELRVNNEEFIAMSGVVNSVIYTDSSLIIRDYPSTKWLKFQIVRNKIEKE